MSNTNEDTLVQGLVANLNNNVMAEQRVMNAQMRKAIRFAIKTHEIYQKQKRKGKDIPYITHPLNVGLVLAMAGADEILVQAGILHDTIEDSIEDKKVTKAMLTERFGPMVAQYVEEVTEPDKSKPWIERKQATLEHVKTISIPALWVKTADVICNLSETIDDYHREGEAVFARFKAPSRELLLKHHLAMLVTLLQRWEGFDKGKENPMVFDLKTMKGDLKGIALPIA